MKIRNHIKTSLIAVLLTYFSVATISLSANVLLEKHIEGYAKDTETLVKKYGETDTKIKELDGHFGLSGSPTQNSLVNKSDDLVRKSGGGANGGGKQLDFSPSWLPNRTITGNLDNPKGLLGIYNRKLPDGTWVSDTKNALENIGDFPVANTSNFRTVSKDGYKMLNTPQEFYQNEDQFWTQYNKPWLDDLVSKKADIVILSDKSNDLLKYQWQKVDGEIKYLLDDNLNKIKTGFGREMEYMENLVQQGKYEWVEAEGVYKFIGS